MKYSLRKTPSHLHLTYKYGENNGGLLGRNLVLEVDGSVLTLEIDLSANLLARNKQSPWYLDAVDLSSNYHKLKSLQCPDNLVRTRLIRAWEGIEQPRLRMRLRHLRRRLRRTGRSRDLRRPSGSDVRERPPAVVPRPVFSTTWPCPAYITVTLSFRGQTDTAEEETSDTARNRVEAAAKTGSSALT